MHKVLEAIRRMFNGKRPHTQREQVARAPRIAVRPLHGLRLEVLREGSAVQLQLSNLSYSGIGLLKSDSFEGGPGSEFKVRLLIQGVPYENSLRVVRSDARILGCAFTREDFTLRKAIKNHFRAEIAASKTFRVPSDVLQAQPDGDPHMIRGENHECQIFYLTRAGNLVRFEILFFGNVIEGGPDQVIRIGRVIEDDRTDPFIKGSDLVSSVQGDPHLIEDISRFVADVEQLSEEHRSAILGQLRTG